MSTEKDMVTLRTGAEVPRAMVIVTMVGLTGLLETDTATFYELVMLARNPQHQLWGDTGSRLEELSLTSGGRIHDANRAVILAAVEGEELEMRIVNPIQN